HHEMLAVPHGGNERHVRSDSFIEVRGIDHETAGISDQPEVFGQHDPNGLLAGWCGGNFLPNRHSWQYARTAPVFKFSGSQVRRSIHSFPQRYLSIDWGSPTAQPLEFDCIADIAADAIDANVSVLVESSAGQRWFGQHCPGRGMRIRLFASVPTRTQGDEL